MNVQHKMIVFFQTPRLIFIFHHAKTVFSDTMGHLCHGDSSRVPQSYLAWTNVHATQPVA